MLAQKLETNLSLNGMVGKDLPDKVVEHIFRQNIGKAIADVGDISYKDYADNKTPIKLEQITDAFCDNLIVYMLYPEEDLRKSKGNKAILNQTLLGNFNKIIRDAFVENNVRPTIINGKHTSKICKSNNLKDRITEEQLERASKLMGTTYNKKITRENDYLITFKVDLMDENLEKIMEHLPAILKQLEGKGIYLSDIDITIDYAGTLDKPELINYLTQHLGYRLQGEHQEGDRTILDNDRTVGTNCLTYIYNSKQATVRAKLYNKFVCQLTSPGGVCKEHITNFIDCPTKRLGEVFANDLANARGITRTEITIYIGTTLDYEEITEFMREAYEIIEKPLFYTVPLKNQYRAITERIQRLGNTLCIVDRTNRKFYTAYYANKITGKIVGTNTDYKTPNNTKTRKLSEEELDAFAEREFNDKVDKLQQCNAIAKIPLQILNIYYDNEGTVFTQQEAKIKLEGHCYPAPGRLRDEELIPSAFKDNNIVFALGTKRKDGYCELRDYPGLIPIETRTKEEIKRINKELENAILHNNAKEELKAVLLHTEEEVKEALANYLQAAEEANKAKELYELHKEAEQRETRRREMDEEEVLDYFRTTATSSSDLPAGDLELVCIKITAKEDCYIGLYKIEKEYYTCFLDAFCKKVLQRTFTTLTRTNVRGTIYLHSNQHLTLASKVLGLHKKGNSRYGSRDYSQYTNKVWVYAAKEEENTVILDNNLLSELKQKKEEKEAIVNLLPNPTKSIITSEPCPIKVVDCVKLEDCEDGELLHITKIYEVDYRKIKKYVMLDKKERYVVSSSFLEEKLITCNGIDTATIVIIKCLRQRTSKNNKKIMDVEIRVSKRLLTKS